MRLAALYNVWADWEMLEHSIRNIRPLVDGVIIVGSSRSNYGEYYELPDKREIWRSEERRVGKECRCGGWRDQWRRRGNVGEEAVDIRERANEERVECGGRRKNR